jgi:hypothetical protein
MKDESGADDAVTHPQHDRNPYYRDNRPWDAEIIRWPSWADVESAVRRMEDYCFPIVHLNPTEDVDYEYKFIVVGGAGRWAVADYMGEWQYEDPAGSDKETKLWSSDQGYYCLEKNVLTDIEKVLRITKAFYDTGSYDGLDAVG